MGLFDDETLTHLRTHLTEGNLPTLVEQIHNDDNWPQVKMSISAKTRMGDIGRWGMATHYRDHMARMMMLLANARRDAARDVPEG